MEENKIMKRQTTETTSKIVELIEFLDIMEFTNEDLEKALKLANEALAYASKDIEEKAVLLLAEARDKVQTMLFLAIDEGIITINELDNDALSICGIIETLAEVDDDCKEQDIKHIYEFAINYLGHQGKEPKEFENTEELAKTILDKYTGRA
jgi:hypothetical protein